MSSVPRWLGNLIFVALASLFIWLLLSVRLQNINSLLPPEAQEASRALKAGDTAKATALFDKLLAAQPDSPPLYETICQTCTLHGQWKLAETYARRGVQACKYASLEERAALYRLLSGILSETEQTRPQVKAIEAAQRAYQLAPQDMQTLNSLGYVLADNEVGLDQANLCLTQALRMAQKAADGSLESQVALAQIEDSYGWLLCRQGKFAAAIDALTQSLADLPDIEADATTLKVMYYHLGVAYRKAGLPEQARNNLNISLHYDPAYAAAQAEIAALSMTPPAPVRNPPPSTSQKPSGASTPGPAKPNPSALSSAKR